MIIRGGVSKHPHFFNMDISTHIWMMPISAEEDFDWAKVPFHFNMKDVTYYRPALNDDNEVIKHCCIIGLNGEEFQIEIPYKEFVLIRNKWQKRNLVGLS